MHIFSVIEFYGSMGVIYKKSRTKVALLFDFVDINLVTTLKNHSQKMSFEGR